MGLTWVPMGTGNNEGSKVCELSGGQKRGEAEVRKLGFLAQLGTICSNDPMG